MTLEHCTKDELLAILDSLCRSRETRELVELALPAINAARMQKRVDRAKVLDDAYALSKIRLQDLTEAYKERKFQDVPKDVVIKTAAFMIDCDKCKRALDELMGIEVYDGA